VADSADDPEMVLQKKSRSEGLPPTPPLWKFLISTKGGWGVGPMADDNSAEWDRGKRAKVLPRGCP
jgi:hypothetical protein